VFHRNHVQGETQDVSVALLMDYSGSMNGASYECQRRIALILHELFNDFPMVDFHMYGHESWYTNQVYGLTSIETTYYKKPNGGTNEGTALARAAQEFLAVSPKKNRKVILTMGDGHSNQEEIKKSVKMIRKAGIEVYDILIDG
ncbi:MAG: vWA domain-containing protein, partial [Candidatus Poseidoniales archaeon]